MRVYELTVKSLADDLLGRDLTSTELAVTEDNYYVTFGAICDTGPEAPHAIRDVLSKVHYIPER